MQPSEPAKMKNYLNRGFREQNTEWKPQSLNMGKGGTIEGKGMIQVDHPENSQYQVGKSWDEPNLFEDDEASKIKDALIGRELQVLGEVGKMASRLRQAGFAQSSIEDFILDYLL